MNAAVVEVHEHLIPAAFIAGLEGGDVLLLERVPAGTSILWGPTLRADGMLSVGLSVPTSGEIAMTVRLTDGRVTVDLPTARVSTEHQT